MLKYVVIIALSVIITLPAIGQNNTTWCGKKCAVVLTYDDALNVHLDKVIPALDSLGFKGTFYLSGFFPSFRARVKDWSLVAQRGHELGNHTLYHPCDARPPGREWVSPDYDVSRYTVQRMVDEITMANVLLEALDGKSQRTFAYPCGDRKAGDSSYVEQIRGMFAGARGVEAKMQRFDEIDLFDVGAFMINGQSGDELISLVREAMAREALLVFLFHGVGGEHSLNVSLSDHRQLLQFLEQNDEDIWVAPMLEICNWIKENTKRGK